jgi:chlorite dismutase
MSTINLTLYDVLRKELNLTEEKSKNVAKAIQKAMEENVADKEIATKDFVRMEIAEAKADIIKWMFIFWVGQLAAMFGLLYFFIKK